MKRILIINGPNLNMLGKREPEIYGKLTLEQIKEYTQSKLPSSVESEWYQSNIEGEIVTRIQQAVGENWQALIINPGAYAHTSVAIRDALTILSIPIIEVHLTNTQAREDFRQRKLTAPIAKSIMEGFGADSYYLAIYSQINL